MRCPHCAESASRIEPVEENIMPDQPADPIHYDMKIPPEPKHPDENNEPAKKHGDKIDTGPANRSDNSDRDEKSGSA